MFTFDAESLAMASTLAGIVTSIVIFLWKKLLKPAIKLMDDHEEIKKSIDIIKGEVTPNGGGSMKDAVNGLRETCESIEKTQKILDQRSKAALHYTDRPLFETDELGRLSWSNESFQELTKENGDFSEGLDWISIINEEEREEFLKEFTSCLEMCRRVDIETESVKGQKIHFLGYPYRISETSQQGFLIHLYKEN
tara:strand:- start:828 stop:1412 length:585 start_codon:yes stop_codon:yes gene_type:complete